MYGRIVYVVVSAASVSGARSLDVFNSSGDAAYNNNKHMCTVFDELKDYSFIHNKPPLLTSTLGNES